MGTPALLSGALLATVIAAASCGDPPICQSEVFVAIQTSQIVVDADTAAAGIQADVEVRTSLAPGETITLDILNGDRLLDTHVGTVEIGGYVRFTGVEVSTPSTTLRASLDTPCGAAEDERTIEVIAGSGCELALEPLPEIVPMYAPSGVLSTRTDPDPATAGHQLAPTVLTRAGWSVELLRVGDEAAVAQVLTTGPDGTAAFADTLVDGTYRYRATCVGPGFAASSQELAVMVDLTAPTCRLVSPPPGSSITPTLDTNGSISDGIQLEVVAQVDGDDVAGEATQLVVTPVGGAPTTITGTPVDATGRTTFPATLAPPTTPASFELALVAQDHARNVCVAPTPVTSYTVVYQGCEIAVVAPTAVVTSDANNATSDGSQVDLVVQVGAACANRPVVATCGEQTVTSNAAGNGRATLRVTACATAPCEAELACIAAVETAAGIETTAATPIAFDNQGPITTVQLVAPAVPCGATITQAADLDPGTPGLQAVARVTSPGAITQHLDVTNNTGTVRYPATADVTITLGAGTSRLVGSGLDELGNRGSSAPCNVTVAP